MDRLTVSLTDAQREWVTEEATNRDRSKSFIIRQLINAHRGQESVFTKAVNDDEGGTDSQSLSHEIAELKDRVTSIEEQFESITPKADDQRTNSDESTASSSSKRRQTASEATTSVNGNGTTTEETHGTSPSTLGSSVENESLSSENGGQSIAASTESSDQDRTVDEKASLDENQIQKLIHTKTTNSNLAEAVFECWKKLQQRGTASPRMFGEVYADHSAGYESEDVWWESIANILRELPGVESPDSGGRFYRYRY